VEEEALGAEVWDSCWGCCSAQAEEVTATGIMAEVLAVGSVEEEAVVALAASVEAALAAGERAAVGNRDAGAVGTVIRSVRGARWIRKSKKY
jgi:hypothetical protein